MRPTDLAHELDAGWIALWLAIHGGHLAPEVIAARASAALAQYMNGTPQGTFTFEQWRAQFAKLGVVVTEREKEVESSKRLQLQMKEDREYRVHQYCVRFEGSTICTELPVLTHLRTAA